MTSQQKELRALQERLQDLKNTSTLSTQKQLSLKQQLQDMKEKSEKLKSDNSNYEEKLKGLQNLEMSESYPLLTELQKSMESETQELESQLSRLREKLQTVRLTLSNEVQTALQPLKDRNKNLEYELNLQFDELKQKMNENDELEQEVDNTIANRDQNTTRKIMAKYAEWKREYLEGFKK